MIFGIDIFDSVRLFVLQMNVVSVQLSSCKISRCEI